MMFVMIADFFFVNLHCRCFHMIAKSEECFAIVNAEGGMEITL